MYFSSYLADTEIANIQGADIVTNTHMVNTNSQYQHTNISVKPYFTQITEESLRELNPEFFNILHIP